MTGLARHTNTVKKKKKLVRKENNDSKSEREIGVLYLYEF